MTRHKPSDSGTLTQSDKKVEALEQQARDLARSVETMRQQTLAQSNERIDALEQKARDLADFVETLRNQTRLQSEAEIEALGEKARDLALFVESVRKETHLQSETKMAAMGQKARDLAVSVETVREMTLLRSDSEIATLGHAHEQTLAMNEALMLGSLRQHELTEVAENLNAQLSAEITERKESEKALRESEENFRTLADSMSQLAWMTDTDGYIFWYNQRWFEYTGTTLEEMRGWGWRSVHHPAAVESVTAKFTRHIVSGEVWEDTFLIRGLSGEYRWFLSRAVPIRDADGKIIRWFGTNTDIDDVRRAEEILQLSRDELEMRVETRTGELRDANAALKAQVAERNRAQEERITLLKKVLTTQEDERRRIARDMHDHFGQQLTALRLQLELLENMCDEEALCDKVAETKEIAKQLDSDVSFLVWELRPTALDDLGLKDALAHYVEKWTAQFEIPAEFHVRNLDGAHLSGEAETCFYRIAQEALNNAYKHAQATQASVLLEKRGGEIVMIVEDNGTGFQPDKKVNRRKGLGLIGMRERAALVGGTVEIESGAGKGTTIFVRIPAKSEPPAVAGG